jgi:hypothetical protein
MFGCFCISVHCQARTCLLLPSSFLRAWDRLYTLVLQLLWYRRSYLPYQTKSTSPYKFGLKNPYNQNREKLHFLFSFFGYFLFLVFFIFLYFSIHPFSFSQKINIIVFMLPWIIHELADSTNPWPLQLINYIQNKTAYKISIITYIKKFKNS